jgi:hypothetical protein
MIFDRPEVPIRRSEAGLQLLKLSMQQWWRNAQHLSHRSRAKYVCCCRNREQGHGSLEIHLQDLSVVFHEDPLGWPLMHRNRWQNGSMQGKRQRSESLAQGLDPPFSTWTGISKFRSCQVAKRWGDQGGSLLPRTTTVLICIEYFRPAARLTLE